MNNPLAKSFALLEALAHSERPLGVSELARRLELGKSTVHRMLQSLTQLGYVRRSDPAGCYRASLRLWELGNAVFANLDLPAVAAPFMEALRERTRETIQLAQLDGDEVVCLHKLDSPEAVRPSSRVGDRAPAWCAAPGKAMLAWQGETRLELLAARRVLDDPKAFLREMARVRDDGFALDRGVWREGVCSLAAPVRDPCGRVSAAIVVLGPSERMRPARCRALAGEVVDAARGVGQALGAMRTQPDPTVH